MQSFGPDAVVPLRVTWEDDSGAGEIRVTASVGGRDYDCLLDTGAPHSQLPNDDLTTAFPQEAPETDGRSLFGATRQQRRVRAPRLTVGDMSATDVLVDLTPDGSGAPPLVGLDVFGTRLLDLRIRDAVLRVGPSAPLAYRAQRSSRGHVLLPATVAGEDALGVWDTGAGITVIDAGLVERHPACFTAASTSVGADANGASGELATGLVHGLTLGGRTFAPTPAVVAPIADLARPGDPRFLLILGAPLLAQATWRVDLATSRWDVAATD